MPHAWKPMQRGVWSVLAVCVGLFVLSTAGCGKKDGDTKTSVDSSKPPPEMESLRQRSGAPPVKSGNGQ